MRDSSEVVRARPSPEPVTNPADLLIPVNVGEEHENNLDENKGVLIDDSDASEVVDQEDSIELLSDEHAVNLARLVPQPLLFVPISVYGVTVDALVDSGASMSLIEVDLVPPDMYPLESGSDQPVKGLGANTISPLGSIVTSIIIGHVSFEGEFLVVPAGSSEHSVILGCNFFQDHRMSIDTAWNRLSAPITTGHWEIYLQTPAVHTVYRDIPVYATTSHQLSGTESVLVEVNTGTITVPDTHEFYYTSWSNSSSKSYLPNRLIGVEGVLQFKNSQATILLENGDMDGLVKLKAGQLLGTVSTLVDVEINSVLPSATWTIAEIQEQIDLGKLSDTQTQDALQMILDRSGVLSRSGEDIGCAGVTQHKIELHDSTPIRQRPRRFPEPVALEIEKQCEELRQLDIIEYSKSPWSSPVVPVIKKDKSLRLCVDYRQLNRVTKADRFPVPNVSDLVYGLFGVKFFTLLDLRKGYYQVPLHPDSKECTAFSTSYNHYQCKRLSFGLKNAPGAFQREMQAVLQEFSRKQVVVYIDDILIMSKSYEEHLQLVGSVLATLDRYHMKINLVKCHWFQEEVVFLGHKVSIRGISKDEAYVKDVMDFPQPTNVKELRSFLGLVNFQRKFIANCSVISKQLTALTKYSDKTNLKWTTQMEEAFTQLKDAMVKDILLSYPDYRPIAEKMQLSTDACKFGAGACLTQVQDSQERVIAYASTTFSPAQSNYCVLEQELTAIRWALKVFKGFLYGVSFVLFTDHRPLVYMHNMVGHNSRIMRTFEELSAFNYEIKYKSGKCNYIADTLSRLHGQLPSLPTSTLAGLPSGLQVLQQVPGGGDSMVSSLFLVLEQHKGMHDPHLMMPSSIDELRHTLSAELLQSPSQYGITLDKVTKNNLKLAALPGQFPMSEFFLAFHHLCKLQVWVHHGMAQPVVCDSTTLSCVTDPALRVHIQCIHGVHYNPLVENKLFQEPEWQLETECIDPADCCDLEVDSDTEDVGISAMLARVAELKSICHCNPISKVPIVNVHVGDVVFCGLIDTGAQISLVSEFVWNQLTDDERNTASLQETSIPIKSFGNSGVKVTSIILLSIRVGSVNLPNMPFGVVPETALPSCFILGLNVIHAGGMVLNFDNGQETLTVEGEQALFRHIRFSERA